MDFEGPVQHIPPCLTISVFLTLMILCRTVLLRKDAFDEREMDFYEALYTQSQAQFGAYVESGTVLNNYAHIFDLLIRLRQVCFPIMSPACGYMQACT